MRVAVVALAAVLAVVAVRSAPEPEFGEKWGYVDVRSGAHMFWWLYGFEGKLNPEKPLVMWLQGGPGGSGCGFGNFLEIGPLDVDLKRRNTSWTSRANVLFVDNPVGTGFSYVDEASLLTKTDQEIAVDLVTLTKAFYQANPQFAHTPFFVFCESYGGKMTSVFGEALHKAIIAEQLNIDFRGVALGDGWVSPIDSMAAWVPYLYTFSLINEAGVEELNTIVDQTRKAMAEGEWTTATSLWGKMESAVGKLAANVDWYNVLIHFDHPNEYAAKLSRKMPTDELATLFKTHVAPLQAQSIDALMNGQVRRYLGVNATWGAQSGEVFSHLSGAFMQNSIGSVDYLLKAGVPVTIYQGQLDLIVPTIGTEKYMKTLSWSGMDEFNRAVNKPVKVDGQVAFFHQQYEHLNFFSIMKAGHMVPADQGAAALAMLSMVLDQNS